MLALLLSSLSRTQLAMFVRKALRIAMPSPPMKGRAMAHDNGVSSITDIANRWIPTPMAATRFRWIASRRGPWANPGGSCRRILRRRTAHRRGMCCGAFDVRTAVLAGTARALTRGDGMLASLGSQLRNGTRGSVDSSEIQWTTTYSLAICPGNSL